MPHPTPIHSGPDFRDLLQSRNTVFAMFYIKGTASQAMSPIFESLCEEHQSPPDIAFAIVQKDELPGLCMEYGITRDTTLTFVTFIRTRKIDTANGRDSRDLEDMVARHVATRARHNKPKLTGNSPARRTRTRSRSPPRRRSSPPPVPSDRSPPRGRARFRPNSSILVQPSRPAVPSTGFVPAEMVRIIQRAPFTFERPVRPVYRGRDGRYREADFELSRNERAVEASYMDTSGPLDVLRTVARYPDPRGSRHR